MAKKSMGGQERPPVGRSQPATRDHSKTDVDEKKQHRWVEDAVEDDEVREEAVSRAQRH
jgi:hypothetical protein